MSRVARTPTEEFRTLKTWLASDPGLSLIPGDSLSPARRAAAEVAVRQVCPNLVEFSVQRLAGRTSIRCVLDQPDGTRRAITVLRPPRPEESEKRIGSRG